jgi:surfeit locus 1 family protein
VSLRLGSRLYSPRPFTTGLTLVVLALLIWLGRWQIHRYHEKQVLFDAFERGTTSTVPLDATSAPMSRYQHVEARGHFDPSRQILIDNMVDGERVGFYVITPFALERGGWVLVNRGWVPLGARRSDLPPVPAETAERQITGRISNLPAPGIHLGTPVALAPPFPIVAGFPTRAQIQSVVREGRWSEAGDAILLDATEPDGFARHWTPAEFPPMRHLGYAVQWFALALALTVIYFITNTHRVVPAA